MNDWPRFYEEHRERHPHLGFREAGHPAATATVTAIVEKFKQSRIDFQDATTASKRMVFEPARTRGLHWSTLHDYALEAMKARGPADAARHDLSSREGAEAASKGCERCHGNGLVTVWCAWPNAVKREPITEAVVMRYPIAVAAYCVCALGRWIEANQARRCPDVRKRMPDLKDVIEGRGNGGWLIDPPDTLPSFRFNPSKRGEWLQTIGNANAF